ncbi:MAG: ATP synthase subunit I [Lachnospiraceae bacterium]|nr:ATP synthase subunit I [Lachnospiraceae bacterium]
MQEGKQTLYELLMGITVCLVIMLTGNLFVSNHLAYNVGLLTGGVIAGGMSFHMYHSLLQATLYDEETAAKKVKISSLIRMFFMLAGLVAAVLLPQWISIIGVALGVLSLKFSAYLQPLTHKVLNKIINKGR